MSSSAICTPPLDFAIKHGLVPNLDPKPSPATSGDRDHCGLDDGIHNKKEWAVSAEEMSTLFNLLHQSFTHGRPYTYYQFEARIKRHPFTVNFTRDVVICACRYFFLHGVFDSAFWDQLCRRGESPCEADQIILGAEHTNVSEPAVTVSILREQGHQTIH
jgi:hypothetical protein